MKMKFTRYLSERSYGMQYRFLGNTDLRVSELGLGCEYLEPQPWEIFSSVINQAMDRGINIMDAFMPHPHARDMLGRVLANGKRQQMILQTHLGAIMEGNQYKQSHDLEKSKIYIQDFFKRCHTDYIDILMLHFVDTPLHKQEIFNYGLVEYAQKLKEAGVVRYIGMSSHDANISAEIVKTGILDVLMFSSNIAFDMMPAEYELDSYLFKDEFYQQQNSYSIDPQRAELYRLCAQQGVGITVMKPLAAGRLLDEKRSPFGKAMTVPQCIRYCLDRPAVASTLVGVSNEAELHDMLRYLDSSEEELDYSFIYSSPKVSLEGKCMYCNHCLPCPANINIGKVTKYLDLATDAPADSPIFKHYEALEHSASDCIACHSCEPRCPFHVPVVENMERAKEIFGYIYPPCK